MGPSWTSTARRSPRPCSKPRCSATSAAPSPTRGAPSRASSRPRTAARSSSTRSGSGPAARGGEPVDVWVLTATNEDLRRAIRERRFREDLYHRLAVLTLSLPPLRDRGEDVVRLAEHFLARACADYGVAPKALTAGAFAALRAHPWPGNVRELANLMERIALLSAEREVTAEALGLPAVPRPAPVPAAPAAASPAGGASSLQDAVRERGAGAPREAGGH